MLAKKYKLPVQSFVKKAGKTHRSRHFLLKVFDPAKKYSRVGVIISRKTAAKAAKRNQLKRIVFNFFRQHIAALPIKDYLVIVLPSAAEADKEELILGLRESI